MDAIQPTILPLVDAFGVPARDWLSMRWLAGLIVLASCATAHAPMVKQGPLVAVEPQPLTDRQIFRIALDSLVDVVVVREEADGYAMAYGSGSYVGRDPGGFMVILTAAHLFRNEPDPMKAGIVVRVSEDVPYGTPNKTSAARLKAIDVDADLALLTLVTDLPRERLKVGEPLKQLDPCWIAANPDEAPTTISRCIVSRVNFPGQHGHGTAQITGLAWPGSSGSAVLNDRGELVGLVSAVDAVDDPMNAGQRVIVEEIGYIVQQPAIAKALAKAGVK